jgi:uncharacterized membrane protein
MLRILKISGWLLMLLFASVITLTSLRYFVLTPEAAIGQPLGDRFAEYINALQIHIAGSALALFLGVWNFWGKSRDKYPFLHRWLGRVYLLAVLVGGTSGFYLGLTAFGGLPTQMGFVLLAVLWLSTGVMAYLRVRQRDFLSHREWMIRNYALTLAAVTLRLWLPAFLSLGFSFVEAYVTIAWLSWVPNLLISELIIRNRTRGHYQIADASSVTNHQVI